MVIPVLFKVITTFVGVILAVPLCEDVGELDDVPVNDTEGVTDDVADGDEVPVEVMVPLRDGSI